MYDEVLVPTDGSDPSTTAVEQGIEIADRFGGRIHFLHVVDVGVEMAASGTGNIADDLAETLGDEAAESLDEAASRAEAADVPYERAVLEGVPHEAIVEYGDEHGVDLTVLGESGRSGLGERLLGSTTDRVAGSAGTSVLIARD